MRTLLFVLFALVVSCSALAAPRGGGEHEVSNQPGASAGRRARGRRRAGEAVLRPLLMCNPYMCATPAAPRAPCPLPRRPAARTPPLPRRPAATAVIIAAAAAAAPGGGRGRARRGIRPRRAGALTLHQQRAPPLRPALRGPRARRPGSSPSGGWLEPVRGMYWNPMMDVLPVHDGATSALRLLLLPPPRRLSLTILPLRCSGGEMPTSRSYIGKKGVG